VGDQPLHSGVRRRVDLIAVPYDSARRGERMGAGPEALMPQLQEALRRAGHPVRSAVVELAGSVAGFHPVDEATVALIGARDLDPLETALLETSRVRRIVPARLRADLADTLAPIASRRRTAYLHLDLDVLDPCEGRVNGYAAPGGLSRDDVAWAIEQIATSFDVSAAARTALDPAMDPDRRALDAALSLGLALAARGAEACSRRN
jgi:arginase family enzyme